MKDDAFVTNPFFDIDPKIENMSPRDSDNYGIRYFVSTPVGSDFQYNIDLYSGNSIERESTARKTIFGIATVEILRLRISLKALFQECMIRINFLRE